MQQNKMPARNFQRDARERKHAQDAELNKTAEPYPFYEHLVKEPKKFLSSPESVYAQDFTSKVSLTKEKQWSTWGPIPKPFIRMARQQMRTTTQQDFDHPVLGSEFHEAPVYTAYRLEQDKPSEVTGSEIQDMIVYGPVPLVESCREARWNTTYNRDYTPPPLQHRGFPAL